MNRSIFRRGVLATAGLGALAALLLSGPVATVQAEQGATPAAGTGKLATVVFAGGCFWCTEADFDKVPGVVETVSGYAGGSTDNPTYEQVIAGLGGHREVVQVTYDPAKVSFETLLAFYWRTVDPTDAGGQFCDRGASYTTAIYAGSATELAQATAAKEAVAKTLGKNLATEVTRLPSNGFFPAEGYHQDYYLKNPAKYRFYRWNCGRDARLEALWGGNAGKLPEG